MQQNFQIESFSHMYYYQYSASFDSPNNRGAVYFWKKCTDASDWFLAQKSFGNEQLFNNNNFTNAETNYSVQIVDNVSTNTYDFAVSGQWGGVRKFVDEIPMLYIPAELNPNNLPPKTLLPWSNMFISNNTTGVPVAVPDTTTYPGDHYYEIAAIDYSEKLHSDFKKATRARGFVQITGHTLNGDPTYNINNAHRCGPFIFAKKDVPVRVKFYNLF